MVLAKVTQFKLLDIVHAQPVPAVTPIVPGPPAEEKACPPRFTE
jgi:hypothetical protein